MSLLNQRLKHLGRQFKAKEGEIHILISAWHCAHFSKEDSDLLFSRYVQTPLFWDELRTRIEINKEDGHVLVQYIEAFLTELVEAEKKHAPIPKRSFRSLLCSLTLWVKARKKADLVER